VGLVILIYIIIFTSLLTMSIMLRNEIETQDDKTANVRAFVEKVK